MGPPLTCPKRTDSERLSAEMKLALEGRSLWQGAGCVGRFAFHSSRNTGRAGMVTSPRALRQSCFCADRRTGTGCAMLYRFPSPVTVWAAATLAPDRSRSPSASVTRSRPCRRCPSPARAALFLPRPGLAVFRHSRVSGKRSQTLNSLRRKHIMANPRDPLMKSGSVASGYDLAQWNRRAPEAQRHLLASLQGRR